uniref:Uncharacterized protein n=1 Tax=Glossina austeni TaxID=7395 RepID=A0A1A9V9D9_GLOAU
MMDLPLAVLGVEFLRISSFTRLLLFACCLKETADDDNNNGDDNDVNSSQSDPDILTLNRKSVKILYLMPTPQEARWRLERDLHDLSVRESNFHFLDDDDDSYSLPLPYT